MLKEKLLAFFKKKEEKNKLNPKFERILDKLVEEAVKNPEKEKEILEALENAFRKKGDKKNAFSRNSRGNSLSGAEIQL